MQLRLTKIFLLFIVFTSFCHPVPAQIKFTATITPSIVGKDETAALTLMVENAARVEEIKPPALNNFKVINGPTPEYQIDINNGNKGHIGVTYLLKPKAKGEFIIGPATASAAGKKFRSNPVKIKVINGSTGNGAGSIFPFGGMEPFEEPVSENTYDDFILKKSEQVPDKINKNIFIKVETDKTSCFVGEPIVVSYKLYTRLKSESNIVKNPSFNEFSVIDLPHSGDSRYVVEKLNGRAYNVYTLRRAQLYPLQQGAIELEGASVENDIHFVKEEYVDKNNPAFDLNGDYIPGKLPAEAIINEKITLQSDSVIIHVKALPGDKKPASFNGAVGNFNIRADVEKNYFTTDDAGKFQITISGEGNLTLVTAPELVLPAGIEAFEPLVKEQLNKISVPVSGTKTFEFGFNITKAGSYTLPAVEYSFFDAAGRQYKTISTKPIAISVSKGSGNKTVLPAAVTSSARESFFETLFTNRWLIIVPVALLILTGLFFWLKADERRNQDVIANVKAEQEADEPSVPPLLHNPLVRTEEMLLTNNVREFYPILNKELCDFLGKRLRLMPEMMNRKNIADALDTAGISVEMKIAIQETLDEISVQLYTPFANETRLQHYYEKALTAVQALQKTTV